MTNEEIKETIARQLGNSVMKKELDVKKELNILQGIIHSDLPAYIKYETSKPYPQEGVEIMWIFCIRIKEGRLEVERIKFNAHRVEYDTNNFSVVVDKYFVKATQKEWDLSFDKFLKYLAI